MFEAAAEPITSLYVHVPFCAQKCAYCAFYSEASSGELVNRYVAALVGEASNPASGRFSPDGTGRFGDGNSGSDSAAEARGCVK